MIKDAGVDVHLLLKTLSNAIHDYQQVSRGHHAAPYFEYEDNLFSKHILPPNVHLDMDLVSFKLPLKAHS